MGPSRDCTTRPCRFTTHVPELHANCIMARQTHQGVARSIRARFCNSCHPWTLGGDGFASDTRGVDFQAPWASTVEIIPGPQRVTRNELCSRLLCCLWLPSTMSRSRSPFRSESLGPLYRGSPPHAPMLPKIVLSRIALCVPQTPGVFRLWTSGVPERSCGI